MAIPSTGSISMSTIQTEFGGSSPISLSEYYRSNTYEAAVSGNNTTVPQSGTIKMSQFRGTFQARYIVWKLLGAGGGGGYGVFKTALDQEKLRDGGNSTITYNGTTYTANGGAGGDNGAIYYNQSGSAGQNADTSQGYSENFGTCWRRKPAAMVRMATAGTGFAAGGSGAGGDNPDQYDQSSGNKGEGGLAGSEQTQTDYVAVGGSIVYDLGVGGAGGDSFHLMARMAFLVLLLLILMELRSCQNWH